MVHSAHGDKCGKREDSDFPLHAPEQAIREQVKHRPSVLTGASNKAGAIDSVAAPALQKGRFSVENVARSSFLPKSGSSIYPECCRGSTGRDDTANACVYIITCMGANFCLVRGSCCSFPLICILQRLQVYSVFYGELKYGWARVSIAIVSN